MPDTPFQFADLALAGAVGILALVPAALALLALAALLRAADAERRLGRGPFLGLVGLLGTGLAAGSLLLAWMWGGATHLKPRCLARGEPVYARVLYPGGDDTGTPEPLAVARLRIESAGDQPPAWAAGLLAPGRLAEYEWRRGDGLLLRVARDGRPTPLEASSADAVLRVRRISQASSFWARITVDRFRLTDLATGTLLADGEEMWVDAGPARYRCGIASGPYPVRGDGYPDSDGVADFLFRAIRPEP